MRSFGTPQMAMLLRWMGAKNWLTPIWKNENGRLKRNEAIPAAAPPSENLLKKHLAEQGKQSD